MQTKRPSSAPLGAERRAHKRHDVLVRVAIRDAERLRSMFATDLSRGGIFLATRHAFPIGRALAVKLVHPVTEAELEVDAEVVNVRRNADGSVRGCGLRFTSFDEAIQKRIARFVEGVVAPPDEARPAAAAPSLGAALPELPPDAPEEKARARALMRRGLVLATEGNAIGAAHLLARATSLDPGEEHLWDLLHRIEPQVVAATRALAADEGADEQEAVSAGDGGEPSVLEPAARRKARLLFEAARSCYDLKDVDGTVAFLQRTIVADPTHAAAYYALAGVFTEERHAPDKGVELCRKAVELDPGNAEYRETLDALVAAVEET
jgi:uncharacterized protein (TIGR02266 family)